MGRMWATCQQHNGITKAIADVVEKTERETKHPGEKTTEDLPPLELLPNRWEEEIGANNIDRIRNTTIHRQLRSELDLKQARVETLL